MKKLLKKQKIIYTGGFGASMFLGMTSFFKSLYVSSIINIVCNGLANILNISTSSTMNYNQTVEKSQPIKHIKINPFIKFNAKIY